jgi:uncharacterized protein DUF5990
MLRLVEHELTLRIILEAPPAGVDFGLQEGSGNNYKTVQTQTSKTSDMTFTFTVRAKQNANGAPTFLGPFTQGPPQSRFVYLDIGTYAGQTGTHWARRLKVPLAGITWEMVEQASDSARLLETRVPGTGRDGGPNCATVKPFAGWKLAKK